MHSNQQLEVKETKKQPQVAATPSWYATIWRWHFYAGFIFAPFLIILAITGGIYLFKPQIEEWLYRDAITIQAQSEKWTATQQIEAVKNAYPTANITSYSPSTMQDRATEIKVIENGESKSIYVNPYNGQVTGEVNNDQRFMVIIKELHGELMIGKTGDRLVELASCWAVILIVTGIYLWWPRGNRSLFGTLIPRFSNGKRIFWRDIHVVTGIWLSGLILILIFTGLPWSGVWGEAIQKISTATNTGRPAALSAPPQSTIPTKDIAEVSWATEQVPVPNSLQEGTVTIPIENAIKILEEKSLDNDYTISLPRGDTGVYTVSIRPKKPEGQATLHIDQYSSEVLTDIRFSDYGPLAKAISIGIALHEGRYFGLANQLLCLFVCIGIVFIAVSGLIMWWKRKPKGKLGAPAAPNSTTVSKTLVLIIIAFSLFFPLVGISLIVVLLFDWLLLNRLPKLKQWIG